MPEYSVLSNENIKQILKPYGIKNFNTVKKLSGGSENTNYLITTNNNRYVLCLFEHKSFSHARNLTKLLSHLKTHNFKTTETFPATNGETLTTWNKKPILIKHFIEGKIKYNLPNHLIELVGKALGKLHQDAFLDTIVYEIFKLSNAYFTALELPPEPKINADTFKEGNHSLMVWLNAK